MKSNWGFDTRNIDRRVRPQDDFFRYANGGWLKKNPIPKNESRWGAFTQLRYDTEHKVKAIVTRVSAIRKAPQGSPEQLIRDFYRSALGMKRRNTLGAKPLAPYLKHIRAINDLDSLVSCMGYLGRFGVNGPWHVGVDQDAKRTTHYAVYIEQGGLGLPDRDYYLKNKPEQKRVRAAYEKHIENIHILLGYSTRESRMRREVVMKIETFLAKHSMPKEDLRDPHKTYHKKSAGELARLTPSFSWRHYFNAFGTKLPGAVVVSQPAFLKEVGRGLKAFSLAEWKTYLEWHLANDAASVLSLPFVKENFHFYATVLTGVKHMKPLWRRALGATNANLGDALGKLYVKEHFPPEAKRKMNVMITELFAAYAERMKKLDWMSPVTKKKALEKLRAMNRKIGYPKRWRSYAGLTVRADDYFGNVERSHEWEHRRNVRKMGKRVDRDEWYMTPQTVNAYFAPTMNEIVFPAAMLQAPFFSPTADDAVNYGATGMTIGHELTHSFDDSGSKFDKNGSIKEWWTKADTRRFKAKTKVIEAQFGTYEVAPGIKLNGKLTLGENIADLGGVSIAYDAYQKHLARMGRKNIEGFTPEQRFFLGFAQGERDHARLEYLKTIVAVDPHSPNEFRVNGIVANLPEFHKAFGVCPGDTLYKPRAARAKIW